MSPSTKKESVVNINQCFRLALPIDAEYDNNNNFIIVSKRSFSSKVSILLSINYPDAAAYDMACWWFKTGRWHASTLKIITPFIETLFVPTLSATPCTHNSVIYCLILMLNKLGVVCSHCAFTQWVRNSISPLCGMSSRWLCCQIKDSSCINFET